MRSVHCTEVEVEAAGARGSLRRSRSGSAAGCTERRSAHSSPSDVRCSSGPPLSRCAAAPLPLSAAAPSCAAAAAAPAAASTSATAALAAAWPRSAQRQRLRRPMLHATESSVGGARGAVAARAGRAKAAVAAGSRWSVHVGPWSEIAISKSRGCGAPDEVRSRMRSRARSRGGRRRSDSTRGGARRSAAPPGTAPMAGL